MSEKKKRVAVLGCTGSIGTQTLSVLGSLPEEFERAALTVNSDTEALHALCLKYKPSCVGIASPAREEDFGCEAYFGGDCNERICAREDVDYVMVSLTGMKAVFPLLEAIKRGKKIALANKESIVCAGELVNAALAASNAVLLPVDSEQSAIFQCLQGLNRADVSSLVLTASGGMFRGYTREMLESVTLEQALEHPNWKMGKKITVDCSTLANKGLEVIEASFLFNMPGDAIKVAIHPQSIVHSMVRTRDGAYLAQLGAPDMRLAIQYAFTYPDRLPCVARELELEDFPRLEFEKPDMDVFPSLRLAYDALKTGMTAPAIFNAANEQAVELFLQGRLRFCDIPERVKAALDSVAPQKADYIEAVMQSDSQAREAVRNYK